MVNMTNNMKKKNLILTGAGILLLLLIVMLFDSTKYICRVVTDADLSQFEEISDNATKVPFIDDQEREILLDKVVHRAVPTFNDPIIIEIQNWDIVLCEGKETLWYTLRVNDVDGFVTVFTVMIQSRW